MKNELEELHANGESEFISKNNSITSSGSSIHISDRIMINPIGIFMEEVSNIIIDLYYDGRTISV